MEKRFGNITNTAGDAISGATVTVTTYPAGSTALIYPTDEVGTPITNGTLTTNSKGYYQYYAPNGSYTETYSGTGIQTYSISDISISDDSASLAALAASSGSSLVGFIQSGTGAVARTLQSKERDIVSVKDFGAVGDGVTDDTSAIALALAASKHVIFPAGTYLGRVDILRSNTTLTFGGVTLKGRASDTWILSCLGPNVLSCKIGGGVQLDMALMSNAATTYGARFAGGYDHEFSEIQVTNEPALGFGLRVETGIYASVFRQIHARGVSILGTSMGDAVTTCTFINLDFKRANIRFATSMTFLQPIGQGNGLGDKFTLQDVRNLWVQGGDFEGDGNLYNVGTNVTRIYSIGNDVVNFTGTYPGLNTDNATGSIYYDSISPSAGAPKKLYLRDVKLDWLGSAGGVLFTSFGNNNLELELVSTTGSGTGAYAGVTLKNGSGGTVAGLHTTGNDGVLRFFLASYAEKMQLTSGGYLKATQDGTYNNATGGYHELNSPASGLMALFRNSHATTPSGFDIKFSAGAPNNTTQYFIAAYDNAAGRFTLYSNGSLQIAGSPPTVAAGQLGLGATTATTVGAAGAASALPANPLGYLNINVAGTAAKIPYYNA